MFSSIIVDILCRIASYLSVVFIASLDGPSHPCTVGVVVIVQQLVILSVIRAVVLSRVVDILHTLRYLRRSIARHPRHIYSFFNAVNSLVNEHLKLHIGVIVVVIRLV